MDDTLVARFNKAWCEFFPKNEVPQPTGQQLLAIALVIQQHEHGHVLWDQITKAVDDLWAAKIKAEVDKAFEATMCRQCKIQPLAYAGARFCGAGCSAEFEMHLKP